MSEGQAWIQVFSELGDSIHWMQIWWATWLAPSTSGMKARLVSLWCFVATMFPHQSLAPLSSWLTNRMWFSVVCTLIDNEYASSQWSKCCGLTRSSWVSPKQILPQYQIYHNINAKGSPKKMLFSERDQGRDTKKEQGMSITFSQSDWFIPKNERLWLAITTSEMTVMSDVYSPTYNLNCSVTAKTSSRIIMTLWQNLHIGICNGAAMEQANQSSGVWGRVLNRTWSWRHWNMNKQLLNLLHLRGRWSSSSTALQMVWSYNLIYFTR